MSEPRRLFEGPEATEFERGLLEAWQTEQPGPEARRKTLALLGIAGTAAAGAAALNGAAAAGATLAPKGIGIGAFVIAKWTAVAVLAVGVGVTAVTYVTHGKTPPKVAPGPPAATTATSRAPVAVELRSPRELSAPAPEPEPVRAPPTLESPAPLAPERGRTATRASEPPAPAHATAPAPTGLAASAHPPADSALSEQVTTVDGARAALTRHDPKGALALLDGYAARFPGGTFRQEADVLRVEAQVAMGDREAAARSGARFLAAYPDSPHVGRVRALLERVTP